MATTVNYKIFIFHTLISLKSEIIIFIGDKNQNQVIGIFWLIIIVIRSLIQSLTYQHHFDRTFDIGTSIRTALTNMIYKKVCKFLL
jgi:hypothetical protein